jgi:hypothetical protein
VSQEETKMNKTHTHTHTKRHSTENKAWTAKSYQFLRRYSIGNTLGTRWEHIGNIVIGSSTFWGFGNESNNYPLFYAISSCWMATFLGFFFLLVIEVIHSIGNSLGTHWELYVLRMWKG